MANRRAVWHKAYNYEVPFTPTLLDAEGKFHNPDLEWREIGVMESAGAEGSAAGGVDPNIDALVGAIMALDPENPEHFTKAGLPNAVTLTEQTGIETTTEMRDKAWAIVLKQRGEG